MQEQGGAITQLEQTAQGLAVTVEQNKNDAASALQQTADSITAAVAAAIRISVSHRPGRAPT